MNHSGNEHQQLIVVHDILCGKLKIKNVGDCLQLFRELFSHM